MPRTLPKSIFRATMATVPTIDLEPTAVAAGGDGSSPPARRRRRELVTIDPCLTAHPALGELVVHGRFPGAREVTLRVSAATGERVVLPRPSAAPAGRIHEDVAGRRWRISATSFFQSGPAA